MSEPDSMSSDWDLRFSSLSVRFPGIKPSLVATDFFSVYFKREQLLPLISYLKSEGFTYLTDLCGMHYPPGYLDPGSRAQVDDGDLSEQLVTSSVELEERAEFPIPVTKGYLGLVYHLHNLSGNLRIRLKTSFPANDPKIGSLTSLFKGANWMERETFDFYGIVFTGHPNMKRILNVDEMVAFPMRKEFPLEDQHRKDKQDQYFGR